MIDCHQCEAAAACLLRPSLWVGDGFGCVGSNGEALQASLRRQAFDQRQTSGGCEWERLSVLL
jgi:hypothetical protein